MFNITRMHGMDNFKMHDVIYSYYSYSQARSSTCHSLTDPILQAVKYGALLEHEIIKSQCIFILFYVCTWG